MAREINDGRGRLGGRQAGTPNKITADLRVMIRDLVQENIEQIRQDLATLEPKERLIFLEKLMNYVVPKAASTMARVGDVADWDSFINPTN